MKRGIITSAILLYLLGGNGASVSLGSGFLSVQNRPSLEKILEPFIESGRIKQKYLVYKRVRMTSSQGRPYLYHTYRIPGLPPVMTSTAASSFSIVNSSSGNILDIRFKDFPVYYGVDHNGNGKFEPELGEQYYDHDEGNRGINGNETIYVEKIPS
ncbi:hypothetical protein J4430_03320 [Candidatus Woesearchaeota archaeon]|nr:hypothetical protein [Candidatus Woesearchaeota archaeon]